MRVALVLPGQGSQRPGMGATWCDTPGWALVEQASALLGRDLQSLLLDADAEVLRATREAQVATYLTSLLALDALGTPAGVAAVTPRLTQAGARRVLPLPVGGAFHTPLMAPARERLDAALRTTAYGAPRVPVLANVTAAPYDGDVAGLLSRQLTEPVRWREQLLALPPVDAVVEVGPGRVLTGLVSRTLRGVRALSVARPSDLEVLQ